MIGVKEAEKQVIVEMMFLLQRADMCEMSGKKVSITSQRASSLSGSDNSIFQGGHRMESLLQALYHENETGHFFKKFMMKASNMVIFLLSVC